MALSEIQLVNTCGICEEIVDKPEIRKHKCLAGFKKFYVDKNRYFYPVCEDNTIIRRSAMNNGEENIAIDETPIVSNKESETFNDFSDSMDIDELFIEEVSKHEVLNNYSIPLQQRNRAIINETWIEVSKALGGRLDPKQAAKKWKILRDSYSRELAKEKLPSGAERPTLKRKWKHFDRMDFLRDTIYRKNTSDNLPGNEENSENNENIPPIPKKGRMSIIPMDDTASTALNKIADAITTISAIPEPVQLPMLPLPDKQDDVDGLMLIISVQLRKLPERKRRTLIFEILSFVNDKINNILF